VVPGGGSASPDERFDRSALRRSVIVGVAIGTPLSLLFLWLAARGIDRGEVWDAITSVSLAWLAGVAAGIFGTYVFFSLRWWVILSTLAPIRRRRVVAYVVGGAAITNVVPGRPGEFFRGFWAARSARTSFATGMGTVVVDRACDVIVLVGALVAVAPLVSRPDWVGALLAFSVAAAVVLVALLGVALWRTRSHEVSSAPHAGTVRRIVDAFVRGLATVRTAREAVVIILLTIGAWAAWAFAAWSCAHAVGFSLSVIDLVFLTAVVNLGLSIPSTSGFVGTYQWLCVSALSVFSIGRTDAFAFAVVMHAMSLIPVTLVGAGVLAWMGITREWTAPARAMDEPAPGRV
jgi:uncharacterized protein (TIRG00374 family)